MPIEGIQDVFEEQARLNKKKRYLNFRTDQTAADWSRLAREYFEIDSRANFAYCMRKASALAEAELPEPEQAEEWWNK